MVCSEDVKDADSGRIWIALSLNASGSRRGSGRRRLRIIVFKRLRSILRWRGRRGGFMRAWLDSRLRTPTDLGPNLRSL